METNVAIAWLAGIVIGVLFGGFFGFAYGLQAGKKHRSGVTPSLYLSRDDVLSLVGHRMHEIIRIVRERVPASQRSVRPTLSDQELVNHSEYMREAVRLQNAWLALRRPEVESAIRHVTAMDLAVPIDQPNS